MISFFTFNILLILCASANNTAKTVQLEAINKRSRDDSQSDSDAEGIVCASLHNCVF